MGARKIGLAASWGFGGGSPLVIPLASGSPVILPGRRDGLVVVTISDSGSRVNLDPGLAILSELDSRGVSTLTLTDSSFVEGEMTRLGRPVVKPKTDFVWVLFASAPRLPRPCRGHPEYVLDLLDGALKGRRWGAYIAKTSICERAVRRIGTPALVFSVNEALPPAVIAGLSARKAGKRWIGHFPILLGRRPDCNYYPADNHLAYGDQLRDLMLAANVAPESISVTGSYTYDQHVGRNRADDRRKVGADFPRAKGKQIITVASEAYPDPETELLPVLRAVTRIQEAHVILKLHPSDQLERFEELTTQWGVRADLDLIKIYPLGQLLGASELVMCATSNVAVQAAVIGTPTLMCDFSGKSSSVDFVAEGLCLGCKQPELVEGTVRGILFDPAQRASAFGAMSTGIRRFNGPNDGLSTVRIADEIVAQAALKLKAPQKGHWQH